MPAPAGIFNFCTKAVRTHFCIYLLKGSEPAFYINMAIASKYLTVKRSTLPKAGKGLFTTIFIPKGTLITEYKGKITTWKDADHDEGRNLYIFYVNKNHVIDARTNKTLARYANDARGLNRIKGQHNNSAYSSEGNRIFIKATRDIAPGDEILVGYGKDYWKVIKELNN
jgi:SET domain-containing protein